MVKSKRPFRIHSAHHLHLQSRNCQKLQCIRSLLIWHTCFVFCTLLPNAEHGYFSQTSEHALSPGDLHGLYFIHSHLMGNAACLKVVYGVCILYTLTSNGMQLTFPDICACTVSMWHSTLYFVHNCLMGNMAPFPRLHSTHCVHVVRTWFITFSDFYVSVISVWYTWLALCILLPHG